MRLSSEQQALLDYPIKSKIFIHGLAGTGKTTAGTYWLQKLLKSRIPAHQILVFVPQRALAQRYQDCLREMDEEVHSLINTMTLGGLARRMVELYWPIVSREAGFGSPNQTPHFLTMETAQYYMAHLVRPLMEEERYFESLTINRNRIYSQILDNLNKSAIVGFPYQEIGDRLKSAWIGDIEQLHIYDDVQACVNRFRAFCLQNNLLDFSLQVELFKEHLWPSVLCREYLTRSFHHLIVDNVEEDTPVTHDILREWIPAFNSALVIFDESAGYRFFLGADVHSALSLRKECQVVLSFSQNQVNTPPIAYLKSGIKHAIAHLQGEAEAFPEPSNNLIQAALIKPEKNPKYFPAMIKWVADQIKIAIDEGTPPGEIVVLAPFMPDVLRFSLANQLDSLGIRNRSHRPSRSLRDEPDTQTMLTLAAIAFPSWGMEPKPVNLSYALMEAIEGLDLVRAQLLTTYVYKERSQEFPLLPFETVPLAVRDRVTYRLGDRYDRLRNWLAEVGGEEAHTLDFFFNRIFGEVLSQPGFGFHNDLNSGNTISNLIESVQKFRWAVGDQLSTDDFPVGKEYVQMVQDGVIAAQYVHTWEDRSSEAVFLSPAYTFLISNRPVDIQFWLDIGSPSWYQRLDQPLTQPYVLSRHWERGQLWDAANELDAAHETLRRLSIGLLNRCRIKLYLGMSEVDVRGFENRGLLLRIFQHVLQRSQRGKA